jgi:hypothetical protein
MTIEQKLKYGMPFLASRRNTWYFPEEVMTGERAMARWRIGPIWEAPAEFEDLDLSVLPSHLKQQMYRGMPLRMEEDFIVPRGFDLQPRTDLFHSPELSMKTGHNIYILSHHKSPTATHKDILYGNAVREVRGVIDGYSLATLITPNPESNAAKALAVAFASQEVATPIIQITDAGDAEPSFSWRPVVANDFNTIPVGRLALQLDKAYTTERLTNILGAFFTGVAADPESLMTYEHDLIRYGREPSLQDAAQMRVHEQLVTFIRECQIRNIDLAAPILDFTNPASFMSDESSMYDWHKMIDGAVYHGEDAKKPVLDDVDMLIVPDGSGHYELAARLATEGNATQVVGVVPKGNHAVSDQHIGTPARRPSSVYASYLPNPYRTPAIQQILNMPDTLHALIDDSDTLEALGMRHEYLRKQIPDDVSASGIAALSLFSPKHFMDGRWQPKDIYGGGGVSLQPGSTIVISVTGGTDRSAQDIIRALRYKSVAA